MLTSLLAYVKGLVRRNAIDAEVNEELRFHVEMETRANIDRGMTPQEARRVALRDLGGVTQTREAVRDVRGAWVDAIAQGVRLGLRSLKRNPVFYAAVGTTLGIGLAVAVTLFNVEDAIFFRPLEVPTAARLYRIEVHAASSSANRARVDRRAVDQLNAAALPKFARFAGVEQFQRDVRLNGLTTSVFCAEVTPSFFEVLDVPLSFTPRSGTARRTTTQTGPDTGIDNVIIGYDLWQRHLGGRRDVVGTVIVLRDISVSTFAPYDRRVTVVGIAPRGFYLPGNAELWYQSRPTGRMRVKGLVLWAEAAPGVFSFSDRDLAPLRLALAAGADDRAVARPLLEAMRPDASPVVLVLLLAVVGVLAIGWVHAASVMGTRFYANRHAVQTKIALGASWGRIVWEMSIDGIQLSLISFVVSLPLSTLATTWVVGVLPFLDGRRVAGGTAGVLFAAGITALFVGLYTLLTGWLVRREMVASGRRANTPRANRVTVGLSACSYALVVAFVYAAAVFSLSYVRTYNENLGFSTANLLSVNLTLPVDLIVREIKAPQAARVTVLVEDAIRSVPGVVRVSHTDGTPFGGNATRGEVVAVDRGLTQVVTADTRSAGAGLFGALGVPVIAGRDFATMDETAARPVAIVNRTLAGRLWATDAVVGRTLTVSGNEYEIVGVCADFVDSWRGPVGGMVFSAEAPSIVSEYVVRTRGKAEAEMSAILRTARRIEPRANVAGFTYDELREKHAHAQRAYAAFTVLIVLAAVLIAAFGIFAIVSEAVRANAKQVGIHLAIGASPRAVLRYVSSRLLRWICAGSLLGVVVGFATMMALRSAIPHVRSFEPMAGVACSAILLLSVVVALLRPAAAIRRTVIASVLKEQ